MGKNAQRNARSDPRYHGFKSESDRSLDEVSRAQYMSSVIIHNNLTSIDLYCRCERVVSLKFSSCDQLYELWLFLSVNTCLHRNS